MKEQKQFKYHVNTKIIYDYMKENNLNKKQFSERCGFCVKTLNKLLKGFDNISLFVLFNLLAVLNVRSKDLIGF